MGISKNIIPSCKPVSYTHLDVYKRQVLLTHNAARSAVDRINGFTDTIKKNKNYKILASADTQGPVSYTHLDVYKRQASTDRRNIEKWEDKKCCI